MLRNITIEDHAYDGHGLYLANTSGNEVTDLVSAASGFMGLVLGNVGSSVFRRVHLTGDTTYAMYLEHSQNNRFFDLNALGMHGGIHLTGASGGNLFNRVRVAEGEGSPIELVTDNDLAPNVFVQVTISGMQKGFGLVGSDNNVVSGLTVTNVAEAGLRFERSGGASAGADRNTVNLVLAANNTENVGFGGSNVNSDNTLSQIAAVHGDYGVRLRNRSTNTRFAGHLLVGDNFTANCQQNGGSNPGLVNTTCTTAGTDGSSAYTAGYLSSAVLRTNRSAASAFVGKLAVDDPVNTSDTDGARTSYNGTDWFGFAHPWRTWGREGDAFPAYFNRGSWAGAIIDGETGRIWDWRLRASDTAFLNRTGNGAAANEDFLPGETCPSAAHGNAVATDQATSPNTYLLSAIEIVDPEAPGYGAAGDHDGLCESGESCLYAPNFGAYQGEGDYFAHGACDFQDGAVTGVTLYAYPVNGAP